MSDQRDLMVRAALAAWGLQARSCDLFAERENSIYRVSTSSATYALRLHRKNYVTNAELRSELIWMSHLRRCGMNIPEPLALPDGNHILAYEGVNIDCLSWLPGVSFSECIEAADKDDLIKICSEVGQEMARLHNISDAWDLPDGFERRTWDGSGLVGEQPIWGTFWTHPMLDQEQQLLLLKLRNVVREQLSHDKFDYGLIHADLVRENVMVADGQVAFIDFDDSGFGYRLFDLATSLVKLQFLPQYPSLKNALLAGYSEFRLVDEGQLSLFMAIRAATYVGWIAQRADEPSAMGKARRYIKQACILAEEYFQDEDS